MLASSPFISASECARRIGISRRGVERLCDRGIIPTVTGAGGVRRIDRRKFDSLYPAPLAPRPSDVIHALADARRALEGIKAGKAVIQVRAALDRAEQAFRRGGFS